MSSDISTKQEQLKILAATLAKDTSIPFYLDRHKNKYHIVFGSGPANANIIFIGEAPGRQEALTGEPFVGRAGKILDNNLLLAGIKRSKVYITSIVKDRPPQNRTPAYREVEAYFPYLLKQIEIIQPRTLITLGGVALQAFKAYLPTDQTKIHKLHAKSMDMSINGHNYQLIPMYHPAAAFYDNKLKDTISSDFKKLKHILVEGEN